MSSDRSRIRSFPLAALGCGLGLAAASLPASGAAAQAQAKPSGRIMAQAQIKTQAAPPGAEAPAADGLAGTPAAASAESAASAAAPAAEAAENAKLANLRGEVSALIDDLVQARSRAALLGKSLFKTQVRVRIQNLAGPDPILAKIILKLDGAPIYRGDAAALGGDEARKVFDSIIAPGAHVLSAEIEQHSRSDAAYGYTLHETYRFQALREKRSELTLVLDDDSDLADEFPEDSEGEYDIRIKLRVRSKDLKDD